MREIKPELVNADEHEIIVLKNIPQHQSLVKTNRLLLLQAISCMVVVLLMVIVVMLGFILVPADNVLENIQTTKHSGQLMYEVQNPVLSAEINTLKGQLVGLVSGSIESKLRTLEESIREGSVRTSLGTIEDLRNDVKVLRSYSDPVKSPPKVQHSDELLKEVYHLKSLIYFILTSCGLMIAAIGGFWVKNHLRLADQRTVKLASLHRRK